MLTSKRSTLFALVLATFLPTSNAYMRQHKQRALLDVCMHPFTLQFSLDSHNLFSGAFVDAPLAVYDNTLGKTTVTGDVKECLCLSALPTFIQSDTVANAAANIAGVGVVATALNALVRLILHM